jgi:hypothetical protein
VVDGRVTVFDHKAKDCFPSFVEMWLIGVPVEE